MMHTVWREIGLQYARRHVSSPVSARSWTDKVSLPVHSGGNIRSYDMALDDSGGLHIAYIHAGVESSGVYYLQSQDGGEHWEQPLLLSEPGPDWSRASLYYDIDLLPVNQILHVVWKQEGVIVKHARRRLDDTAWSHPKTIDEDGRKPKLAAMNSGRLMMLSLGSVPGYNKICLKRQNVSLDRGRTWEDVERILAPVAGCLGWMYVLEDSDGNYYLIASAYEYIDVEEFIEKIWWSKWDGQGWTRPRVALWPGMSYEALGTQPDFPSATISQGNLLHVVFHTDEGNIWYTRRPLPASQASLRTFPTPTSEGTSETPSPKASQVPGPTEGPTSVSHSQQNPELNRSLPPTQGSLPPHILGVIASAIVVGGVVAWSLMKRRNR
jgi:hypothetical protein